MLLLEILNILKLQMCFHSMRQALKERPGPLMVGYFIPHPVCLRAQICSYSVSIVPMERAWKAFPQRVYEKAAIFELFHEDPRDTSLDKSLPIGQESYLMLRISYAQQA